MTNFPFSSTAGIFLSSINIYICSGTEAYTASCVMDIDPFFPWGLISCCVRNTTDLHLVRRIQLLGSESHNPFVFVYCLIKHCAKFLFIWTVH
jgi:hypothetical protein